jgi:hypothetical protein
MGKSKDGRAAPTLGRYAVHFGIAVIVGGNPGLLGTKGTCLKVCGLGLKEGPAESPLRTAEPVKREELASGNGQQLPACKAIPGEVCD